MNSIDVLQQYRIHKQKMFIEHGWCPDSYQEWLIDKYIEMSHIIDSKCPIGALDLVSSLKVEKEIMMEEIAKLKKEIDSLKTTIGQLMTQQQNYPPNIYKLETCTVCKNFKQFCICNKPHWKWNEIICKSE
jgi:hypothetical protein